MFQVQIAAHQSAPVAADAFRSHRRAPVALAEVASIITGGAKTNQADGAIFPALHFSVRRGEVTPQKFWSTDFQQDVILAHDTHTSPCLERSWLLVAGTTGSRIMDRPQGRGPGHRRSPVSDKPASAASLARCCRVRSDDLRAE